MLKPFYTENLIEAGVDEVGRGCLAGPVVAAAVILPKNINIEGLNDSKKLNENQRELLKIEILKNAVCYAIAEIDNHQIDKINILNASFLAMHNALDALTLTPEMILVDGNRFKPYKFIPYQCIIKGDGKFQSIAAASILAKCYRDDLMKTLSKTFGHYGWEHNMGYPTRLHYEGIKKYGITEFHRKTYKGVID